MPDVVGDWRTGPEGPTSMSTEASDLGWRPGYWPGEVVVYVNGTATTFVRDGGSFDPDGDLLYMRYVWGGSVLRVWND